MVSQSVKHHPVKPFLFSVVTVVAPASVRATEDRSCAVDSTCIASVHHKNHKSPTTNHQASMDQPSETPLSIFLSELLAGQSRVNLVHDQNKTTLALPCCHTPRKIPRHKRRSMDMICRFRDTNPNPPSRRTSMEMAAFDCAGEHKAAADKLLSIQAPLMPMRRGSCLETVAQPGIPHMEKEFMHLVVSPTA
jgi:hypothetical protein